MANGRAPRTPRTQENGVSTVRLDSLPPRECFFTGRGRARSGSPSPRFARATGTGSRPRNRNGLSPAQPERALARATGTGSRPRNRNGLSPAQPERALARWGSMRVAALFMCTGVGVLGCAGPADLDRARGHHDAYADARALAPASPRPSPGNQALDGPIGADGGTLSHLRFAVVGDTRPATVDDTGGYPTSVLTSDLRGHRRASRLPCPWSCRPATTCSPRRRRGRREPGGRPARPLPAGARALPGRLLSGHGRPRVHRRDDLELRAGRLQRGHRELRRVPREAARAHPEDGPLSTRSSRGGRRDLDGEVRLRGGERVDDRARRLARDRSVPTLHVHLRRPPRARVCEHCTGRHAVGGDHGAPPVHARHRRPQATLTLTIQAPRAR